MMKAGHVVLGLALLWEQSLAVPSALVNDLAHDLSVLEEDAQLEHLDLDVRELLASTYGRSCPLMQWYTSPPFEGISRWASRLVKTYYNAWDSKTESCPSDSDIADTPVGCPTTGFSANDHNYKTLLGQGNTLGFVAGTLQLNKDIPAEYQHGLFAHVGESFPLVGRLSDFGKDTKSDSRLAIRLGRLALKIQAPASLDAWGHEINWLFTESLEVFPLSNYAAVSSFAGTRQATTWENFMSTWDFVKILARSGIELFGARSKGLLSKNYYSQLPYALGDQKAMKFSLHPVPNDRCPGVDANGSTREKLAATVREHLSECASVFDLKLQVKRINEDTRNTIYKDAAEYWSEKRVTVGQVTFPRQSFGESATATAEELKAAIGSALHLPDGDLDGVHKLFLNHPGNTAKEHMPIGETNTFRAFFYPAHATARYHTILSKGTSSAVNQYTMPFAAMVAEGSVPAWRGVVDRPASETMDLGEDGMAAEEESES